MERVVIVSGGGNGLGRAICLTLARDLGYDVVVCDIDLDAAKTVVQEVKQSGSNAMAVKCDVTDKEAVELMIETARGFGTVVALVNNAGITRDSMCVKLTDEDWDSVMNINLKSMFLLSRGVCTRWVADNKALAAEAGKEKPPPSFYPQRYIVNISSIVAKGGNFGQVNYATSKAGALGFTMSLAKEMARYNVTVNAVMPGFIKTRMTEMIPSKVKDKITASIPLQDFGEPEDVANVVKFLASSQAKYVTGTSIVCDV